jgi:hypothetical protein
MQRSVERSTFLWRHAVVLAFVLASFALALSRAPFGQDQSYHAFADSRSALGIPNFGDVASNLIFVIAGLAGLWVCFIKHPGKLRNSWIVMFAGIASVGVASAYYHWDPTDQTLVWDRATLTIGFMGLFVAILGEYIDTRLQVLLIPAILLGAASVMYWRFFDDLRLYYWVQAVPLLVLVLLMLLYPAKYSHQWLLLAAGVWYGSAKLAELGDKAVFAATQGVISGHTIKHLLAGIGSLFIAWWLYVRADLSDT